MRFTNAVGKVNPAAVSPLSVYSRIYSTYLLIGGPGYHIHMGLPPNPGGGGTADPTLGYLIYSFSGTVTATTSSGTLLTIVSTPDGINFTTLAQWVASPSSTTSFTIPAEGSGFQLNAGHAIWYQLSAAGAVALNTVYVLSSPPF